MADVHVEIFPDATATLVVLDDAGKEHRVQLDVISSGRPGDDDLTVHRLTATQRVVAGGGPHSATAGAIQLGNGDPDGWVFATKGDGFNRQPMLGNDGSNNVYLGDANASDVVIFPNHYLRYGIAGGGGGLIGTDGLITAGGQLTDGFQVGQNGPLIYSGSGAPSIHAAVKGSLYLRTDGSGVGDRVYIATDTAGGWAALNSAS